jgi:hypothetical protein
MRTYLLLAVAALGLSACGNNDQTDKNANVDESLSAENIVSNDVTAIDAVTGDAANMAADVDVNFTAQQQVASGNASNSTRPSRPPTTRPSATPANTTESAAPATQPASNTTANAI